MILKRVGKVGYELEFSNTISSSASCLHISLLKKCVDDPASIPSLDSMEVKDNLSYEDVPVDILDRQVIRW